MLEMTRRIPASTGASALGFSLVEVAISLAVLAVLMTGILVPLISQIGQHKVAVTEKTLDDVRNALLGFAAAHGRLPCPAIDDGDSSGIEAFAGNPGNGGCTSFIGFVPGHTLGITPVDSRGYVVDGWGTKANRVRYAVSMATVAGVTNPFTSSNGLRNATIAEVAKVNSLLQVCADGSKVQAGINCNQAEPQKYTLTSTAVAVIWSVGANAAAGGTSAHERENQNPNSSPADPRANDGIFVSKTQSDTSSNHYDDIVTWLSFNTLVNRMIAAGQLP